MKILIHTEIDLYALESNDFSKLYDLGITTKGSSIVAQKITLLEEDMYDFLDIIDDHLDREWHLKMYDRGRFTLVIE